MLKNRAERLSHDWFANSTPFLIAAYLSILTVFGLSLTQLLAAFQRADTTASAYADLISDTFDKGFFITIALLGFWIGRIFLGQQLVLRRERIGLWIDELQ